MTFVLTPKEPGTGLWIHFLQIEKARASLRGVVTLVWKNARTAGTRRVFFFPPNSVSSNEVLS